MTTEGEIKPAPIPVITKPRDGGFELRFGADVNAWKVGTVQWRGSSLVVDIGTNTYLPETAEQVREILAVRGLNLVDLSDIQALINKRGKRGGARR